MTSQVLKTLENKGLLERQASPTDTRAKTVHPTAAGRSPAGRAVAAVEAVDADFFTPVNSTNLTRTLNHLIG
jgi:DNA-binding MarR family transcriptional regulator